MKTVVFATSSSDAPASFKTAFRLVEHARCLLLDPSLTIFPVFGSMAITPETKTRFFATVA